MSCIRIDAGHDCEIVYYLDNRIATTLLHPFPRQPSPFGELLVRDRPLRREPLRCPIPARPRIVS